MPDQVTLKGVTGTNRCQVAVAADGEVVVAISAIDNLIRGRPVRPCRTSTHHGLGGDRRPRYAAGVPSVKVPKGFFWAGIAGRHQAESQGPGAGVQRYACSAAGCFTQNLAKAAPVLDAEKRLPADGIRAVVINSGTPTPSPGPKASRT